MNRSLHSASLRSGRREMGECPLPRRGEEHESDEPDEPMSTFALLLTQLVSALSQSALLFFLGVGLTLIFGLMRIVNFAHGALYMLGAFVGYSLGSWSGSYWLALQEHRCWSGFSERAVRVLHPAPALPARCPMPSLMVTFGLATGGRRGRPADLGLRRAPGRRPSRF